MCESGKYQQGSECVDCPEGHTSRPGSTSEEHCQEVCEAGSYGPHGGPCVLCEEGKYKATPGSEECSGECPANTDSAKGSDELADCVCNAGYTADADGKECVACKVGEYKEAKGTTDCHECEAGTYSATEAATSPETCAECPVRSDSPAGSSAVGECKCNAGFSGPDGGLCEECPAGTYKEMSGSGACVECEVGTYSTASGATSKDTCTLCSAVSSSKPGVGSSTCQCNEGYTGPDLGPCEPCSAGTYKSILGTEPCDNLCPANSDSPLASTVITDCKCNAGYTGADGGICSPCGESTYKPSPGSEECTSCPANTHSEVVASVSVTDCTCNKGHAGADCHPCAAGTYKDMKGSGDCVECPMDTYSAVLGAISELTCHPCPKDSTSASGASAKGRRIVGSWVSDRNMGVGGGASPSGVDRGGEEGVRVHGAESVRSGG